MVWPPLHLSCNFVSKSPGVSLSSPGFFVVCQAHAASIMLRSEFWGLQSKTDSVSLCVFYPGMLLCIGSLLEIIVMLKMKRLTFRCCCFLNGTAWWLKIWWYFTMFTIASLLQTFQHHWNAPFSSIFFLYTANISNQIFQVWTHYSIRPASTDFQSTSCVIWFVPCLVRVSVP